jgi:hypothetical protein
MYETVYEEMHKCGAATKLEKEVLANYNGEIVHTKKNVKVYLPNILLRIHNFLCLSMKLVVFPIKNGSLPG